MQRSSGDEIEKRLRGTKPQHIGNSYTSRKSVGLETSGCITIMYWQPMEGSHVGYVHSQSSSYTGHYRVLRLS
jgi:hypothetical protein